MTDPSYVRGYRDGVAAASQEIADFYRRLKEEDATVIQMQIEAQHMMQKLILDRLAPLQDKVRSITPPEPAKEPPP